MDFAPHGIRTNIYNNYFCFRGVGEERKGNGKRTECAGMCVYVQESGRRMEWKNKEDIKSRREKRTEIYLKEEVNCILVKERNKMQCA